MLVNHFLQVLAKKVITKNIIASSDNNVTSYNSDTSSDCDVVGHHPQQQQESNSSSHEKDRQIVMTKTGDDEQLLETSKIVDNINEQHNVTINNQFLKSRKSISTKISNNNPIMIL